MEPENIVETRFQQYFQQYGQLQLILITLILNNLMSIDEQIKQLIQERITKLKQGQAKAHLRMNLLYPEQQKKQDLQKIQTGLSKLVSIHSQVKDRVKKLKNLIPDVTEQTTLCAVYLIYGKVLQTWEAIFLLASKGYSFNIMELIRSMGENLDLIKAFHLDKEQQYLKKWFQGEIIEHKVSRGIEEKFIKEGRIKSIEESGLSPYDMAKDIYRVMSKYTHCSYAALLDCVDVFNENFDWNGYAGTHYTLHNMHALNSVMTANLITLKMTYSELKDFVSYEEVDKILIDFAGPMDEDSLKDIIPKIKK